jgi:hypothetical protein
MTGTGLTRYHQLPYPPTQRVRGNGAADVERLAVRTDAELDTINAEWTVVQKPDSVLYTLPSTSTGWTSGQTYTNFLNWSLVTSWGNRPPSYTGIGPLYPEQWAWYSIAVSLSSIPSGTATVNSRRTLTMRIVDNNNIVRQTFIREDYELGSGETILQLDFVAFLGKNYRINMDYYHANTGSTINITTTSTWLAINRIAAGG